MKDYIFFGGAALLSAVIISAALAIDPRSTPTAPMSVGAGPRDLVKVEGQNLVRFRQTRRDTVTLIRKENQATYLRLTSRRNNDLPTSAKDVAYLPLSTDLQEAFAGKNLKVVIAARSAPENGAPAMRVQYSAGADGHSEWKSFLLTPEWENYTFYFTPPPSSGDLGLDFLAIWADPDGLGRGVEVQSVTLDTREARQEGTPLLK